MVVVPLLELSNPWLYWLIAVVGLILLFLFDQIVIYGVVPSFWIRWLYGRPIVFQGIRRASPIMAFNVVSLVVYVVATSLGEFGYAFAWYGIVVATDIFISRFSVTVMDQDGKTSPVASDLQSALILIDLVLDAIVAALIVGLTVLFLQAVVLK